MPKALKIKEKLKKTALEPTQLVLFVYILLLLSRGIVGLANGTWVEHPAVVVLQLLTFGFPAALWTHARRRKDKEYLKKVGLTRPKLSHAPIILSAVFMLMSGCLLLSIGFSGKSSLEGSFSLYDTFVSRYNATWIGAVWLIIAYALIPAVCEEFVFRGLLTAEYAKHGPLCAVLVSSLWFGFLHFNIMKLPIYLFAGIVLSVLLYATRSVAAAAVAHFAYNLFGLFGQQYVTEFYITAGTAGSAVSILLIILLISSAVFCGAAAKIYRNYAKNGAPSEKTYDPAAKRSLTKELKSCILTPAAAVCTALYLAVSVMLIFT